MNRKWKKRAKNYQENGQLRQKIYIGCLLAAVCCLFVGILACYIYQTVTENSQITAETFYFTTNILGDTKMVTADGAEETGYSFGDTSTENTWNLYGASEHNITIQVQNYYDELRITGKEIAYEGSVTVQNAKGNEIKKGSEAEFPALKLGDSAFEKGTLTPAASGDKAQAELTFSVPAYTEWNYEDGTVVTVRIKSTSPYKKTLTMNFVLYATDTTLKYKVVDSVGSPYAELVLMTNADDTVQPWLEWSDELSIDNTNSLTFTYNDGTFTQQTGMENRNMQISKALQIGESESVYFFKSDTSKNYAKDMTVVTEKNGRYTINLGN